MSSQSLNGLTAVQLQVLMSQMQQMQNFANQQPQSILRVYSQFQPGGGYHGLGQPYQALYGYPYPASGIALIGAGGASVQTIQERQRAAARAIPREGIRAGEITAYRVWRIGGGDILRSVSMDSIWLPNVPMTGDVNTGNGIYCFKERVEATTLGIECGLLMDKSYVDGSVEIWGEIVEHEKGYRAQYAAIKSIDQIYNPPVHVRPSFWSQFVGKPEPAPQQIDRLREKYLDASANDL